MQTVDVQHDIQQVNYTETVQSGNTEKKTAAEVSRKGASFFELLQNLMGNDADEVLTGAELSGLDAESIEKIAQKKNAAMRTELARLKEKGGKHAGVQTPHAGKPDAPEAENPELLLDTDALLASEEGIDVKNALEADAEQQLQRTLFVQSEPDTVSEEAAALPSEEQQHAKKQKSGKTDAESAVAALSQPVSGAIGKMSRQEKVDGTAVSQDNLEKTAKPQPKQHKPVFTIIDERTAHAAPVTADGSVHEAGTAVRVSNAPSVDMAADFRGMTAGFNAAANGTQASHESGAPSFASLVAQQVQDMAPDFVQAGRIVLQDNNAGIIRLQMQPAQLGSVRINLELAGGKKIVGKIIADSKEAYEAFKESLDQLAQAFEQDGFSSAQFDVSWSGEGGSWQSGENEGQFTELFAKNNRLEVMQDYRYADTETVYAFGQDQAVNVFA